MFSIQHLAIYCQTITGVESGHFSKTRCGPYSYSAIPNMRRQWWGKTSFEQAETSSRTRPSQPEYNVDILCFCKPQQCSDLYLLTLSACHLLAYRCLCVCLCWCTCDFPAMTCQNICGDNGSTDDLVEDWEKDCQHVLESWIVDLVRWAGGCSKMEERIRFWQTD